MIGSTGAAVKYRYMLTHVLSFVQAAFKILDTSFAATASIEAKQVRDDKAAANRKRKKKKRAAKSQAASAPSRRSKSTVHARRDTSPRLGGPAVAGPANLLPTLSGTGNSSARSSSLAALGRRSGGNSSQPPAQTSIPVSTTVRASERVRTVSSRFDAYDMQDDASTYSSASESSSSSSGDSSSDDEEAELLIREPATSEEPAVPAGSSKKKKKKKKNTKLHKLAVMEHLGKLQADPPLCIPLPVPSRVKYHTTTSGTPGPTLPSSLAAGIPVYKNTADCVRSTVAPNMDRAAWVADAKLHVRSYVDPMSVICKVVLLFNCLWHLFKCQRNCLFASQVRI